MIRNTIIIFVLIISSYMQLQGQKRMNLISHLNYPYELNDIWAYVDGNDREYALIGLTHGVSIVDLQIPSQPSELHFIPGAISTWRDLKTFQNYAYVSNEEDNGITIIDLSGLPGSVSSVDTVMEGIRTAHNVWIDEGYLYVIGSNKFNGGVAIFDLNDDPRHPNFVGAYEQSYVHDFYSRGNRGYTAEIGQGRMAVIDLSNKSNPTIIGFRDYPGAFTHNTWLSDDGNVCYTTDEYGAAWIRSWDVSNPGNIEPLDMIRSSQSQQEATPHNVHVKNDYLITSYYKDGIQITDASRPNNLIEVGFYDTSPNRSGGGYNGCWGAYPYLPSGLILATDIEEGFFVLQAHFERGCYLEGVVSDLVSGQVIPEVQIEILDQDIFDESLANGQYATGIGDSGTYQVAFSRYGYESDTLTVNLSNGVITQLNVKLKSLARIPLLIEVKDKETLQPIPDAKLLAIAKGGQAEFNYSSSGTGAVFDPQFVINPYDIIVGKWGYVSQETLFFADSSNTQMTIYLEKGYYDDFALDFGWSVTGNASKGSWERAVPVGTYRDGNIIHNPSNDISGDIGNMAYVTDNQDDGPWGYDVDRGTTSLISPWMDLSAYNEPIIQYHYWFVNWSLKNEGQKGNDFLRVSVTDGTDTFDIKTYTGPYDTTWVKEERFFFQKYFDLSNTPIKVIFYTQDLEENNVDAVEAAIDGFAVIESNPTAIENESWNNAISIYPNPVSDILTVDYSLPFPALSQTEGFEFEIVDVNGRIIYRRRLPMAGTKLEIPFPFPPAFYMVIFRHNGEIIKREKLIKRSE